MNVKPVETILIEDIIPDSDALPRFIPAATSRNYESFWAVNPYANTDQSWYNITSKIGNNKITLSIGNNTKDVIIPDGWYATDQSYEKILNLIINGFKEIGAEVLIEVNAETNKLNISSSDGILKKIIFSQPQNKFQESSSYILGFKPNIKEVLFTNSIVSPDSVDLFSDGRFFIIKIQLAQFGSGAFINESSSLIILTNKAVFGSFIEKADINFKKNLFVTDNLSSVTLNVVDGKGFPIYFNKPIYIRFQIDCYIRKDTNF